MGMKIDKLLDQIYLNTIVSFGGTKNNNNNKYTRWSTAT